MRLNKFLAHATGISRREADNIISSGRVFINGTHAALGAQVNETDAITLDNKPVQRPASHTYLLLNKPVGYLCSRRSQGGVPTIFELLPEQYRALKPVGRLDKDSSGLILLTDDGDFAHSMTHPSFHKVKVYEVELDTPLEPLHQQMISDIGVQLEDGKSQFMIEKLEREAQQLSEYRLARDVLKSQPIDKRVARKGAAPTETRASRVEDGANFVAGPASSDLRSESETGAYDGSGKNQYQITMHEGRNRQIRRTFAALGYTVTKLHRTQFGKYTLAQCGTDLYALTSQL